MGLSVTGVGLGWHVKMNESIHWDVRLLGGCILRLFIVLWSFLFVCCFVVVFSGSRGPLFCTNFMALNGLCVPMCL